MTDHPKEAVEAVARALGAHWSQGYRQAHEGMWPDAAAALLDRIAPMLVADAVAREREACATVAAEKAFAIAAAIRSRGAK